MVKNESDIFNFRKIPISWEVTEKLEIPKLRGIELNTDEVDLNLVPFHEFYKIDKRKRGEKTVHFFLADYLFERTFTKIDQTAEFLFSAKMVLSPDFSLYTNMPIVMQMFNHYRKMFVSKYWQELFDMKVIPVACWSDRRSFDFCFDGMPKNSLIAVSSVGVCRNKEAKENFTVGYEKMIETLEPTQILWYGRELPCIDRSIQHIFVQPDYDDRFKKDINRA